MHKNPYNRETITQDILFVWQNMLDVIAEILGVVAGVITRLDGNSFEVFLTSKTDNNPYTAGYTSQYPDSGWYCEQTLKSKGLNHIQNASLDPKWRDNFAAVELNIISYTGVPINRPDGEQFGTVCFLDHKEQPHNQLHIRLIDQVKKMIELSLHTVHARNEVGNRDQLLNNLSKIYPICSYCKKVREKSNNWVPVEKYVHDISGTKASHSICPDCYEIEMQKIEHQKNLF